MSVKPKSGRTSRPDEQTERFRSIESSVVGMYSRHPSPSHKDKLEFASQRMELRLHCCGLSPQDYVGREVLDAGCGTGEYACWFASKGSRVTGIDLSSGSLREARAYAKEAGLNNIHFEKRSVLETGFPDASFDLVYCTGVLHHTPDPSGGLMELCRVLRPAGAVLISVYNSFGCFPREARRQVTFILGGDDLDRRVHWGKKLFPFTARRLMMGERIDVLSALYDYFAIPHEALHSIGQVLSWFDGLELEYAGSFPPARLGDYPAMFAHKGYESVGEELQSLPRRLIGRLGRSRKMRRSRPGLLQRGLVQALWPATGINIFCMCARKHSSCS